MTKPRPICLQFNDHSTDLDRLTAWIASHPDMLERRNPNGTPVIRVDCINVDTGERWTEYSTVWSLRGARYVLGY
jgi:hypothetical protein